ncbi:right-handed parallel beta-helix repeat-containing protein [Streptomyces tanashiensis]|uniref:right-handed parallel beta-helix repeat-containing protein n=1 Tax=Streptomyces tanashiensis TaxID=67367 RepID=UPI0016758273|nr:right-handed parallel beta-helix repeat-containing protein [Streptomyces tanashiensis]
MCSPSAPCSLTGAQSAVRAKLAATPDADVTVLIGDGTYQLGAPWKFGPADSGTAGHPVVWKAAAGAHPVISGATTVTGWTQVGTSGVWSAPVPAGSETRQLYVNGKSAKIAQASRAELGFNGAWTGTSTGYTISGDSAAMAWFGALTAAQVSGVEFTYPGGNGQWTDSRCRVAGFTASTGALTMTQPCWESTTSRSGFSNASGLLPSMSRNNKPTLVQNARSLLSEGEWYLDSAASRLYYQPLAGQQMNSLDVKLPRLESLLQGAGRLANPLHDVTFQGLQFSYATWNAPSGPSGFSDVQSNLRMSLGRNQGLCTFSSPAGTCPFGALTQPLGNVSLTASNNVTLRGNRFTALGGAGLSVMYGSKNTLIQGNEFTDIASTAIILGCTYDPTPADPTHADGIRKNCTPDAAAVSGDTIGENEILTGTTVSDNIIHRIGVDYASACGITLLFSRGTTITHNNLYDLPYTGITAGVIQGHVDDANHPQNSTNINADNTISNNLIHHYLSVRHDGGAVYVEGHQAKYHYKPDGTIDPVQTLAHGLQVTGNVAYDSPAANFTYYDDAGAEWVNWKGNVGFAGGSASQGGCSPTGHLWITDNYFSNKIQYYPCGQPTDTHASGNTTIPASPGPTDIPSAMLSGAGVREANSTFASTAAAKITYVSPTGGATQVLVAGEGFNSATTVYVKNTPASGVTRLSTGFLLVPVPVGTTAGQISVGTRVDDTDAGITYSGFSLSSNRTHGDLNNDVHYATANGSTATYTFTGTGIQIYGEKNTDQGDIGVSIDGGPQQRVSTTDTQRRSNVSVFATGGLDEGTHKIVVTKLSGSYAVLDGFTPTHALPDLAGRVDDTDPAITYSGFSTDSNRGFGDYGDNIHYASANGSTAAYKFTGTTVAVYGEKYTDQGDIGITIDGGTQTVVSTVPADGARKANVVLYSATGLTNAEHTIVVTKLSGSYTTLDGFSING